MHYYQFNIGDYRKDTVHLSRLEHGIYRDLIDWYYLEEQPIPKETQSVMRRLRLATDEEAKALENVLADFFTLSDDGFRQARIDDEIAQYHANCEKNQQNGKKGGRPKKEKTQSVSSGLPNETQVKAKKTLTNNQEPLTNNQFKEVPTVLVPDLAGQAREADRPASCPTQKLIDLYHQHLPMLPRVEVMNDTRRKHLAARWRSVVTEKEIATSQDPRAQAIEFFDWYFSRVAQSPFLTGKSKNWRADFDFLVNPQKFTKVVEGHYHKEAA